MWTLILNKKVAEIFGASRADSFAAQHVERSMER